MRKEALKLIDDGKVIKECNGVYKVEDKIVIIKTLPGRTEISCSCQNHARFNKSPALCKHKIATIMRWVIEK